MIEPSEVGKIVTNAEAKKFVEDHEYKVKNNYQKLVDEFNIATRNQEQQRIKEEKIMSENQICSVSAIKSLKINVADLNVKELTKLINEQFYDPMIMKAILCISSSIFYSGNGKEIIPYNERIRDWFQDLRQIGQESVEGTAMRASLKGSGEEGSNVMENNIFVIKAPRDPNNMELLHEMFVGLQLNDLRREIPNFSYVFGGFKCSPPVIDKDTKEISSWCSNTNSVVNYVVYENIQPSVPMSIFSQKSTFEQFANRMLQICYAIDLAHKRKDFTHYDLHAGNVLDRKTKYDQFYIPYTTENGITEYLLTNGIATIIDYGISHITYEGHGFGDYKREDFQVFANRSFPISDIYKFLLMNMRAMFYAKNDECFNKCRALLAFFNDSEPAEEVLLQQDKGYFYLPYNSKTMHVRVMDFAAYLRMVCEQYGVPNFVHKTPREGVKILGCGDDYSNEVCYTNYGIIKELGVDKFDFHVKDVVQFVTVYEQIERGNYPNVDEFLQKLKDNFDYQANFDKIVNKLQKWYNKAVDIGKTIQVYDISQLNLSQILSDDILLENYRSYVNKMVELLDIFKRRELLIKSMEFISMKYGKNMDVLTLFGIDNAFSEMVNFFNYYSKEIFTQAQRIHSEIERSWNMFQNVVAKKPAMEWWDSGLKFYMMTVA